jgi:hypothetical protein
MPEMSRILDKKQLDGFGLGNYNLWIVKLVHQ